MRVWTELIQKRVPVPNEIFGLNVDPFLLQFTKPHPPFVKIFAVRPLCISNRLDPGADHALFVQIEQHGLDDGHIVVYQKSESLRQRSPPHFGITDEGTNQPLDAVRHPCTVAPSSKPEPVAEIICTTVHAPSPDKALP